LRQKLQKYQPDPECCFPLIVGGYVLDFYEAKAGASMDLKKLLADNKKKMDKRVLSVLPPRHANPEINQFYMMMRDYPERKGKGLRGTLCLLSCEMFRGDKKACLDTAAAIELFESWVLVHDDIEDGSDMRRGGRTLHRMHGIPLALNAGDAMNNRMWQLVLGNRTILGVDLTLRIADEFLFMINQTTEGQHIELSWTQNGRFDMKEKDYFCMCKKKTAWYTCICPLRLGGMIGKAPPRFLESLEDVGTDMGLAFQIQDDLLNLMGDEKKYGKEIFGDIREGKRTLALIHALANCGQKKRARLESIMKKPRKRLTEKDVRVVLETMEGCGSINYSRKKAAALACSARRKFDRATARVPDSSAKQTVKDLIDFVISREK
jgi:geranylgeranyl diphosphate synthase type II